MSESNTKSPETTEYIPNPKHVTKIVEGDELTETELNIVDSIRLGFEVADIHGKRQIMIIGEVFARMVADFAPKLALGHSNIDEFAKVFHTSLDANWPMVVEMRNRADREMAGPAN